jgi:hypothetical protein
VGIGNATESVVVFPQGSQPQPVKAGESVTGVLNSLQSSPQQIKVRKYDELTDEEKSKLASSKDIRELLDIVSPGTDKQKFDDELSELRKHRDDLETQNLLLSKNTPDIRNDWGSYITHELSGAMRRAGARTFKEYSEKRGKHLAELHKKITEAKTPEEKKQWQSEWDSIVDSGDRILSQSLGHDVGYAKDHDPLSKDQLNQFEIWYKALKDTDEQLDEANDKISNRINEFYKRFDEALLGHDPVNTTRDVVGDSIKSRKLPEGDLSDPEDAKLQSYIDNRVPMMAISSSSLEDLMNAGEFRHVFDLKSGGIAGRLDGPEFKRYLKNRKKVEFEKMGVPMKAGAKSRPVYGFIGNNSDLSKFMPMHGKFSLRDYGDMVVKFKPEVKDDITVTVDDSMGSRDGQQLASPANAVSKRSVPHSASVNLDGKDHEDMLVSPRRRQPRYVEWQGGRRLKLSDIDSLVIPVNVWAALPQNIKDMVVSYGIKVELMAPRGQ